MAILRKIPIQICSVLLLLFGELSATIAVLCSPPTIDSQWTELNTWPIQRTIESITVSSLYLWAIEETEGMIPTENDDNVFSCPRLGPRQSCGGGWFVLPGQLDQLDANDKEIWGVNDRNQVYKRRVNGGGDWTRVTPEIPGQDVANDCDTCFSLVTVSAEGYVWGVATNNTIYRCPTLDCIDTSEWTSVDPDTPLVQIDAGDDEVWGVNGSNHIFKRPVNGSGEWMVVPGEMRYVSASRGDYIWGITSNDSLYVCEKPCTGEWQHIGGSFQEVDGGSTDEAVGVTTNNVTVFLFAREILNVIVDCDLTSAPDSGMMTSTSTNPETMLNSQTVNSKVSSDNTETLIAFGVGAACVVGVILLLAIIVIGMIAVFWRVRKNRRKDQPPIVTNERSDVEMLSLSGRFENQTSQNHDYEMIDSIFPGEIGRTNGLNQGMPVHQTHSDGHGLEDYNLNENAAYTSSAGHVIMTVNDAYNRSINSELASSNVYTEANVAYSKAGDT